MEAAPGFEPGIRVLQTHALPLGYAALLFLQVISNTRDLYNSQLMYHILTYLQTKNRLAHLFFISPSGKTYSSVLETKNQ